VLTVLVSSHFEATHLDHLREAFADARFFQISADGAVPPEWRDAEVLFRCAMPKPALHRALADATGIRWIHSCTAGVEWLLVPEVVGRGITLTRSVTSFGVPVAEWAVGCIFLCAKRYLMLAQLQAARTWMGVPHEPPADSVRDKTVGIVGCGAIGREVARLCAALGTLVLGLRRHPAPLPTWGNMPNEGRLYLQTSSWVVTTPGLVMSLTTRSLTGALHAAEAHRSGRALPAASSVATACWLAMGSATARVWPARSRPDAHRRPSGGRAGSSRCGRRLPPATPPETAALAP
jgi:hypothetical protein